MRRRAFALPVHHGPSGIAACCQTCSPLPALYGAVPPPLAKLNAFQLSAVDAEGAMNSASILAAFKSKGMDASRDHPACCDGKCVNTYPGIHVSYDNIDRFPAWNETFNGGNSPPSTGKHTPLVLRQQSDPTGHVRSKSERHHPCDRESAALPSPLSIDP